MSATSQSPVRPLVSIVLPTFNRLKYLGAAVDSVFVQTFGNWELLIADDGSDAETLDYLSRLEQAPRVQLIRLTHSGNISAVRNDALRRARGDYIAFLDSDDVWMPSKLERQLASLVSRPDRRWSYTGFKLVDASLRALDRPIRFSGAAGWIVDSVLDMQTAVVTPAVLARRDLIEEVGLFDEQLAICGDFELWVRLALASPVDCIREPLVLVRRHAEHCYDDVATCRDFARALDRSQALIVEPQTRAILRRRRAIANATLARSLATSGLRVPALATLLTSVQYSWLYREWWQLGAGATARVLTPKKLRTQLRRIRRAGSQARP
jgi:glycosyltransferase involved in cell wall biosynthesis